MINRGSVHTPDGVGGGGGSSASPASTSALTNAAATGASQILLAANALRLAFSIYNDSTSPVNVKLGTTASSTSFTKRLLPGEFLTNSMLGVNYTGRIDAIYDSATGNARVTELTV